MQSSICSGSGPPNVNRFDGVLQIDILRGSKPDLDNSLEDGSHDQNYTASRILEYLAAEMKTVLIKSPIISRESQFVLKYFSECMGELHQQHVTLQIQASDENFIDLYHFVDLCTLPQNRPFALLSLLDAALKFKAHACVDFCSTSLKNLPMTNKTALLYLDHPLALIMADKFQPFIDRARLYFANKYKSLSRQKVYLNMSLTSFKAVLLSDLLEVQSEDAVYDFMMIWARKKYPYLKVRREVLSNNLLGLIRSQYMSISKLDCILDCPVIGKELASEFVKKAMLLKSNVLLNEEEVVKKRRYVITNTPSEYFLFKKVVRNESSRECIVYLNLMREECSHLSSTKSHAFSEPYEFGGLNFNLFSYCGRSESRQCFGLFLCVQNTAESPAAYKIYYDFASASVMKPSPNFASKYQGSCTWTGHEAVGLGNPHRYYNAEQRRFAVGHANLFGVPWTQFIANDSPYFINGILHLKVQIRLSNI